MTLAPATDLSSIAAGVLGGYMIVLIGLGWVAARRSRLSEEDYFLAGRGQGFFVTLMTITATFFSSAAILGIPGNVYKHGVAFVLFALNLPVSGACIYILGSRIRRIGSRRGYVTQGDMIADYYGDPPVLRVLVTIVGFLFVLPYVIMQIKAGGFLAQGMFPDAGAVQLFGRELGIFELGTSVLALVTMVYVLVGGMRSVAWTDVLQGVLLLGGMLTAAVVTVVSFGGLTGFWDEVATLPREALALPGPAGAWTPTKLMTVCLFASAGSLVQPAQWMRFYAARSDGVLRKSALAFAIVLPICFLLGVMLVALAGRALYPPEVGVDLASAHAAVGEFDRIVIVMLEERLPALLGAAGLFLVALILVAVLAASMSTADSNLHALSAVVTRDVYDRFVDKRASERRRAWVGRGVIVAATVLALWLVNVGHDDREFAPLKMIADLMFAAIAFSSQLLPCTIDMLFLRRGTRAGAMAGIAAGVVTVFQFTPVPAALFGEHAISEALASSTSLLGTLFDIGFCGCVVNALVFVTVSRFTRRLDPEAVARFADDLRPIPTHRR